MADALTCAESEELLALAALGVLPSADSVDMEQHLTGCAACRETGRVYQRATFALPESLDLLAPRAELRRRLLTAVYSSAAGRPRRHRLRTLWQLIPQSRAATLVAAAGVAAAVVLGVWGATRSTAPSTQTFAVMATTFAPSVQGELTYDASASRSVVSVSGIPEPIASGNQPGMFELWLIPSAGAPIPVAFLSRAPQGTVWTAVVRGDLSRYKSLAATAEATTSATAPSGPEVFSVTIHP